MNTENQNLPTTPDSAADSDCGATTCSTRKDKDRYTTFVFDSEYDDQPDEKSKLYRNMLGEDYQGGVPVIWSKGNQIEILESALDALRKVRENEIDYPAEYVEKWFEDNDVCYW